MRCPRCGLEIELRDSAPPETPEDDAPEKAVVSPPDHPERNGFERR